LKKTIIALLLALLIVSLPVCFADTLNLIYDANGNLVTGDGFYREYNSLNQLVKIRLLNSTGNVQETYVYDPVEEKVLLKRFTIGLMSILKCIMGHGAIIRMLSMRG
jgi:hypothetical protein